MIFKILVIPNPDSVEPVVFTVAEGVVIVELLLVEELEVEFLLEFVVV